MLAELAMARTRFEVRFNKGALAEDAWTERGIDDAEFFLSPNPGEELRPLARIVSGGELSRVMLALKTLGARRPGSSSRPGAGEPSNRVSSKTLIFDEVDAGIGGRVADVVGARLRELGDDFQVLCITHLPQIAARATAQFRIEKAIRGSRTVTSVERLDEPGRVEEIARMIGGSSATVKASALELLRGGTRSTLSGHADRVPRKKGTAGPDHAKAKAKGESETRWRRNT
jgi:DNA repair protein RecN (Recombination protein N)